MSRTPGSLRPPIEQRIVARQLVALAGLAARVAVDSDSAVTHDARVLGRTLSHYRVDHRLGAGGMGSVYRARDLALGRDVALKVVTDGYDASLRERLLREAEANARLQHPAIATFFEAGMADGTAFIAMEYVRGTTLRDRLGGGPVPTDQAVAVASSLLEALHHAHTTGILHRDIKPENVMLTEDGTPKLLDFGLAKALDEEAGNHGTTVDDLTGGRILGTVGYMSPEQLHGADLDARSDVFAVGALLYELIAGRPAFPGANATERIAAILTKDPAPLTAPQVPAALVEILRRTLARDRNARYPSASALLADLRALAASDGVAHLPETLAVVDLRNLLGKAEDEWIGSGIAETLTADLTRVGGLTVVARHKVLKTARQVLAGGETEGAPERLVLGGLLGCRWVLSGSFQRMGPAIRITTSLVEVATGRVIAGEKLDGSMDGIFDMQDRLSRAIVSSLSLRLPTPGEGSDQPPSLQAFEYYARGRRLFLRLEKGTFDQARELYEKAIALEPGHAAALSGLAGLHAMRFTFTTDHQDLEHAAGYARRAIAADPHLGDPHVWLGYALLRQERMDEALDQERQAAELDPANGYPPYFAGCVECFRNRPGEALRYFQCAVTLEPPHAFAWIGLSTTHLSAGNVAEARWCLEKAIELERTPGTVPTPGASAYLGECLRLSGQLTEARAACLSGLEAVERSDHMYRDTFRAVALCSLARISLDADDLGAARAALHQAIAHIRGRPRTLGGGFLMTQALAGLARAGEGAHLLDEALQLFTERDRFNFAIVFSCADDVTLVELGRAALALGRPEGIALLERACQASSFEARLLLRAPEST